jgi:HAD superfamily hydrolase (TIGR01459 family)
MLARRLLLVCANPDVVTELGGQRVKCSGALAELYAEIGGPVYYAGKPHRRIFEKALALAAQLRGAVARERVLVIGDSIRTDIAGARANGFDSLFVASGIHAQVLGSASSYNPSALEQLLGESCVTPSATTWRLMW